MIGTVWKIGWLNLLRDRPALALTFAMPLLFFSIFAAVFGSMDQDGVGPIQTALVFQGAAEPATLAEGLATALARGGRLRLETAESRKQALDRIRSGRLAAAVVVPPDLVASLAGASRDRAAVEILVDRSNPLAAGVLEGTVRGALFELTLESRLPPGAPALQLPVDLRIRDVLDAASGKKPSIAFFAAGIGVMFLLFAVSGRGSLLIEERQSGVLTRMLTTGLGVSRLLAGRWLYLASLGFLQVTLMFVWGSLAFGLDLWSPRHLTGFLLMNLVTAAAAAALGLLLSVICRTRAQLSGVAVVLVLAMSAVGGSLFPRFLMPESMRRLGLATFNAWALDGYQKVFWYQNPLLDLWPQVTVLTALTALFLVAARTFASRWTRGGGL